MKILTTTFILLISFYSYCQSEYYTTDGKNRITKSEAEEMLTKQVDKMTKKLGKQLYGSLTIEHTEKKKGFYNF